MNDTLREDLRALAEQAPIVDLAAQAVRGARGRRAGRLVAAAVTCLLALGGAALLLPVRPTPATVLARPQALAVPLPAKGVGPVEQAFRPSCPTRPCTDDRWRIVTRRGDTYHLGKEAAGPLEVTADGRRIAYYDARRRRIVVRDLASGTTWQAPLKQPAEDFTAEYALRLSPDGLRFVVSGWGGRREPHTLVDVERGTVTDLERGWWPVSVSDGSGPVVLAKPHDTTSQVWVLGHDPVTIGDFTYSYSGLAPDGRTLARLGQTTGRNRQPTVRQDGSLVTFDATRAGRDNRTMISGLPRGLHPSRLGSWLNATEVTLLAVPESPRGATPAVYAVDVRTGTSRKLFTVREDGRAVVPGLVR
ncbi:hypothetical protein GCM10009677_13210 [Sphaerisporangium rubeum]|uniref:WD40 repeat domain-containing protein n=1 Tax=Sphaerisporangium rubeum TaxID=321317 RepID=A0A7X0IEN7_9ACTN|nr:hypothetical protein [Sphaerisporangium rubeum]MBB6473846.1 hypothetical protein [Sphaerisporangium rubeum]